MVVWIDWKFQVQSFKSVAYDLWLLVLAHGRPFQSGKPCALVWEIFLNYFTSNFFLPFSCFLFLEFLLFGIGTCYLNFCYLSFRWILLIFYILCSLALLSKARVQLCLLSLLHFVITTWIPGDLLFSEYVFVYKRKKLHSFFMDTVSKLSNLVLVRGFFFHKFLPLSSKLLFLCLHPSLPK